MSPAKVFFFRTQPLKEHLDHYGHVNHAAYLTLFEMARWELLKEQGHPQAQVMAEKVGPIIIEAHIKYKKEVKLTDEITIETQAQSVQRKTLLLLNQVMKKSDGRVAAQAEYSIALFHMEQRKMLKIDAAWERYFGF